MRSKISAIIAFCFPGPVAIFILNIMGHEIHRSASIGFSWLQCDKIKLSAHCRIGHFNMIRIPCLQMEEKASIRSLNRMKGPFSLIMSTQAAIGNNNSIYRGDYPITSGPASLKLGRLAILTSKHALDCTCSISIGHYSTISGFGTQFWTHGFYHANTGPDRIRIDGSISIGNNVSIGSRCMINPGVSIGHAINVGANACISKSISAPGMYVSQALRYVPNSMVSIKKRLKKNNAYTIVKVYEKYNT